MNRACVFLYWKLFLWAHSGEKCFESYVVLYLFNTRQKCQTANRYTSTGLRDWPNRLIHPNNSTQAVCRVAMTTLATANVFKYAFIASVP
ncbi:hypothetical protein BD779DRAFT_706690 [Infundibulicybe gibba]|nr:hypothetical protein BD779DRAFT_706690 [Infundibulicybe gibba]